MKSAVRTQPGWTVDTQHSSTNLLKSDKHTATIRPDILIRNDRGRVRYVGDAKWKLGSPNNSDFYQLASYQLAFDTPGLLLYPEQDGNVTSENTISGGHPLHLVELPTKHESQSLGYDGYISEIEKATQEALSGIC